MFGGAASATAAAAAEAEVAVEAATATVAAPTAAFGCEIKCCDEVNSFCSTDKATGFGVLVAPATMVANAEDAAGRANANGDERVSIAPDRPVLIAAAAAAVTAALGWGSARDAVAATVACRAESTAGAGAGAGAGAVGGNVTGSSGDCGPWSRNIAATTAAGLGETERAGVKSKEAWL